VGGQSLAAWVTPTLFRAQADRHLAGVLAARLFSIETYVGLGIAVLALLRPSRTKFVWGYSAVALLSINEWVLKRIMALAQAHGAALSLSFGAWHGISAVLYVLACLAVLRLVWNEDFR
jgi:cyanate permease